VGGPTTQWLLGQARRLDAAVCGSVMTVDAGRCVNRLLFATPDGRVARYDKRHLFRMGQEHEHYSAGDATVVVEFRGWRIAPLVCYDLRFPVWSRRRPGYEYDLLVYVANWPARRGYAWRQLLIARAIENQCCLAGVNRIGEDGNGIPHDGGSTLLDALGAPLLAPGPAETVATATLDREALLQLREKFPAHHDADEFQLG
jgi:predicted amidohydrolase